MARRTVVTLVDDLDGGDADETLSFGVDGRSYEVDLSEPNASALREALAPYVAAARRAGSTPRHRAVRRSTAASGADNATIRAWATDNGYQVGVRGRISAEIRAAYAGS